VPFGVKHYISAFLCPSDSVSPAGGPAINNYRYNVGCSDPYAADFTPEAKGGGAFLPSHTFTEADFRDGLSQTAAMSERLVGRQVRSQFDSTRDFWLAGTLGINPDESDDTLLATCRTRMAVPKYYFTHSGFSWMTGAASTIWYNHVAGPNEISTDCALSSAVSGRDPDSSRFYSISARSNHDLGVNLLTMDVSVHFIKNGVNLHVWRALSTRAGGEPVSPDW
jgi:hypothetical protein